MTLTVEEAVSDDVSGLASVIQAGFADAPSALVHYGEFAVDLERLVSDALRLRRERGHHVFTARVSRRIVGGARLAPREFARSSHIATITLLIDPVARGRGYGRTLLEAVTQRALESSSVERLDMRVVASDIALRALVEDCGWAIGRRELEAVATAAGLKDLLIYTRDR
ncbi:MAG: GNAT superfamily N-acetyltransferase [Myxococcota bacterium]